MYVETVGRPGKEVGTVSINVRGRLPRLAGNCKSCSISLSPDGVRESQPSRAVDHCLQLCGQYTVSPRIRWWLRSCSSFPQIISYGVRRSRQNAQLLHDLRTMPSYVSCWGSYVSYVEPGSYVRTACSREQVTLYYVVVLLKYSLLTKMQFYIYRKRVFHIKLNACMPWNWVNMNSYNNIIVSVPLAREPLLSVFVLNVSLNVF